MQQVYAELTALIALHQPEIVAIEEVFFSANAKSALKLGQVRGVAMLAAATCGLPVAEYAPLSIKSSVVGYGLAAKEQVQFMVKRLLDLDEAFDSADAADALAIAICHIHTAQTLLLQGARPMKLAARIAFGTAADGVFDVRPWWRRLRDRRLLRRWRRRPVVSFQFERAGMPVPRFTLRVREDGKGSYQADVTEGASDGAAMSSVRQRSMSTVR